MSDFETAIVMILMYVQGLTVGYMLWAPSTSFKKGLIDSLSLKFLWSKK